jgi:hypothetical protein
VETLAAYGLHPRGFRVNRSMIFSDATEKATHSMSLISHQNGVPEALAGCHTMLIGGHVVEGHVPVSAIRKLLTERPSIKGISLPAMPEGSPGMTGEKTEPFTTYDASDGRAQGVCRRVTVDMLAGCAKSGGD